MAHILVVDDQKNMRATLSIMLRSAGHDVAEAKDGQDACDAVDDESYDLVITDLRMGKVDGIDVLRHVREVSPLTEIIVMTAYGTIETAVEAMRLGAWDYIQKPFSEDELFIKVDKALERRWLSGEFSLLTQEFKERYGFENIVGRSRPIRDVLARIIKIAPTDTTVLITGESGTGKELIAKAVHVNSKRSDRPFVPVNCAAISETLLESELFGHVKGAFTGAVSTRKGLFEEASGGTFFFDEIAETTPSLQAKLLRAVQEREIRRIGDNKPISVDVRIIAATNQDLLEAIRQKTFREDLYYRLNVVRFMLPALRERPEDVPVLVEHFLKKFSAKMGRSVRLAKGVMERLTSYEFPGNVRELENMIEQGVALTMEGDEIQVEDLIPDTSGEENGQTLDAIVAIAEKQAIRAALVNYDSTDRAADALGLSPTTLWRKMKKLKIDNPHRRH
ncbi:MAG: sigma-54-dependent Fis family transcriptional regulator [Deltaproteobacteria bacterium]|nr:sigma-54-dependent Fis family transcriptional regulator [Deltaproteobacteria bacterium]MBN2670826.1 sigma-54-dependent Fis family transcriptional regulator [Deltaproteobacteria bacterium]